MLTEKRDLPPMRKIDPYFRFFNTKEAYEKYSCSVDKVGLWESEKKLISFYVDKCHQILDVGCGTGRTTFGMYEMGYKNVLGIDISEQLLSWAKDHNDTKGYDLRFYHCDAEKMPFSDDSFNFVLFSYNGLTGIPTEERRARVLKEIHRVLTSNGIFIFCAHDRDDGDHGFWYRERKRWLAGTQNPRLHEYGDALIGINDEGDCEFLHYYSKDEIRNLVQSSGFQVVMSSKRSDIAPEPENVLQFSADTRFWVLRKKEGKYN